MDIRNEVLLRAREMGEYQTPAWEKLPSIPLYLDQVVGYLESELAGLLADEGDKAITPSMINNYVKAGIIKPPVKKKYNQSQLAALLTIHSVKQVLPLGRLAGLYSRFDMEDGKALLEEYAQIQDVALHTAAALMEDAAREHTDEQLEGALRTLVLEFALGANAMRMAAVHVLNALDAKEKTESADKNAGKKKG